MSTQHRRRPILEVLDTRLSLSTSGGLATAMPVAHLPAAPEMRLNPQPLPPREDGAWHSMALRMSRDLNPQPLPP